MARRNRSRFTDVRNLGQSTIAPYRPNESATERHSRRLKVNLDYADILKDWCNANAWAFDIKNNNHHWIFKKGTNIFEWWPSTAKLVCNKKFDKGIHCHDYKKVISVLGTIK